MEKNKNSDEDGNDIKIDNSNEKIKNPWMLVSIVLGIALAISLVFVFRGGMTGNVISENEAGKSLVSYLNAQTGGGVEYISSKDIGNLYETTVSYQGQNIPVYITKDGEYFVQGAVSINGNAIANPNIQAPAELPKSDKPVVELYVFTYCPYGTQSEKGIIPAVKLLGNKIDFKIRQIGAMHGEHEKIEAQRQLCINKLYPAKYLDYTLAFALSSEIGNCNGDATCAGPKIDALYNQFGIDKTKIDSCMKTDGVTLYATEESNSQAKGVSGSPTLMINGADAQSGRDSTSYLKTICSAFNTEPAECSQTLSSTSPSAGFGSGTGSASSAA